MQKIGIVDIHDRSQDEKSGRIRGAYPSAMPHPAVGIDNKRTEGKEGGEGRLYCLAQGRNLEKRWCLQNCPQICQNLSSGHTTWWPSM